jgi:hypothetical protein
MQLALNLQNSGQYRVGPPIFNAFEATVDRHPALTRIWLGFNYPRTHQFVCDSHEWGSIPISLMHLERALVTIALLSVA